MNMKTKLLILTILIASMISCKKKTESPAPTTPTNPTTPTTPTPTVSVEFFVNANKYQIREPFDYPFGSPDIIDLTNVFSPIGSGDTCSVTGKKITLKYSTTDTTLCTFNFFTVAPAPPDTYRGTCDIKITPNGSVLLTYGSGPTTPRLVSCKKAVAFE